MSADQNTDRLEGVQTAKGIARRLDRRARTARNLDERRGPRERRRRRSSGRRNAKLGNPQHPGLAVRAYRAIPIGQGRVTSGRHQTGARGWGSEVVADAMRDVLAPVRFATMGVKPRMRGGMGRRRMVAVALEQPMRGSVDHLPNTPDNHDDAQREPRRQEWMTWECHAGLFCRFSRPDSTFF